MEMVYIFRQAVDADLFPIWAILQQAIVRRRQEGSDQWQDGYPNPDVVRNDIAQGSGYVLIDGQNIIGYVSILVNDEPQYEKIEGEWLTDSDFVVLHRVALSADHVGKGLSKRILGFVEEYATKNGINSIKADTNFDNIAMRKTFEKLGYIYCGQVYFRGSPRLAYEKVLV